jgi:hypothetical protein
LRPKIASPFRGHAERRAGEGGGREDQHDQEHDHGVAHPGNMS